MEISHLFSCHIILMFSSFFLTDHHIMNHCMVQMLSWFQSLECGSERSECRHCCSLASHVALMCRRRSSAQLNSATSQTARSDSSVLFAWCHLWWCQSTWCSVSCFELLRDVLKVIYHLTFPLCWSSLIVALIIPPDRPHSTHSQTRTRWRFGSTTAFWAFRIFKPILLPSRVRISQSLLPLVSNFSCLEYFVAVFWRVFVIFSGVLAPYGAEGSPFTVTFSAKVYGNIEL